VNNLCFFSLLLLIFSENNSEDNQKKDFGELEILRQISKIMEEGELSEVFYKKEDITIRIKRGKYVKTLELPKQVGAKETEEEEAQRQFEIIRSPRPGTFYRAPKPDEPPYVEVGVKVSKGDILCQIEAMKFYDKVHAEFSCEIIEIIAQNTQPVEYDEPLFKVKRLS